MRFIPYILYLLLVAFFRTNLHDIFTFGLIEIYLAPLLVILVALNKDILTALWFGFTVGIIYDAPDPHYLGTQMIILSLIGAITAQMKERFNLESLKSRVLLVMTGLFVFAIPHTLIYTTSGTEEFFRILLRGAIPSIVYTSAIGWIYFMFHSGRISYAKLKALF